MVNSDAPTEIVFFPFFGGGHQIPMIDMARILSSHKAKSTVIATPTNASQFQNSISRDQQSGLSISIHVLKLPDNSQLPDTDMSAGPFTDTSILKDPFILFLSETRPDCVIIDRFHRWAAEAIDELQIPRIVFSGTCCFSRCVVESLKRYEPHEKVGSDLEPFVVPGLPDRIVLTRSQLPIFLRNKIEFLKGKPEENSYGTVVNSFYELEPAYVDFVRKEMGIKAWVLGPVSLFNRNLADKAERGKQAAIDEHSCLSWLDSKEPNSVLYISFGSLAQLPPEQITEIAHGLEASNHSFIWAVGKILKSDQEEESKKLFPDGFEERMKNLNKGLIIRGWAPQLLILEHAATGGFLTHCGWNSALEGVSAGVPMVTWPISAEQFFNEKLVTDVLGIGVQVGSKEWKSWNEDKEVVKREKVEAAVKRVMDGGDEAAEMRRRVKEIGEMAKKTVEESGSSWRDAECLIAELKARRKR